MDEATFSPSTRCASAGATRSQKAERGTTIPAVSSAVSGVLDALGEDAPDDPPLRPAAVAAGEPGHHERQHRQEEGARST